MELASILIIPLGVNILHARFIPYNFIKTSVVTGTESPFYSPFGRDDLHGRLSVAKGGRALNNFSFLYGFSSLDFHSKN